MGLDDPCGLLARDSRMDAERRISGSERPGIRSRDHPLTLRECGADTHRREGQYGKQREHRKGQYPA